MAKGKISQETPLMIIGATVTESGANTFTESEIELPLSPFMRQVFIFTDIEIRPGNPDSPGIVGPAACSVSCQVTKSTQTGIIDFGDPDCLAVAIKQLFGDAGAMVYMPPDIAPRMSSGKLTDDYLDILVSNNFFVAIEGNGNAGAKTVNVKVTGFMAKVDADVYAALAGAELNR